MADRLVIVDVPGRYSRRLGEQVPDAAYARAVDGAPPSRLLSTWLDAVCWGLAIALLTCVVVACFGGGPWQ